MNSVEQNVGQVARETPTLTPQVAALREKKDCAKCGLPMVHKKLRWSCAQCRTEYQRKWRKLHPPSDEQRVRSSARAYANVYKGRGKLVPQPCEKCADPEAQMHHVDYDKPLEVHWLCRECHMAEHHPDAAGKLARPRRRYMSHDPGLCSHCLKRPVRITGQRTCKECHCEAQKAYRQRQIDELAALKAVISKNMLSKGNDNGQSEKETGGHTSTG